MLLLNPSYGKITDEKTDKHSRNSTLQTSSILTIFFIFPGLFIPKKPSNNFANYFSNNEKKYILIPLKQNIGICASCEQTNRFQNRRLIKESNLLTFISYSSHSHKELKTTFHPSQLKTIQKRLQGMESIHQVFVLDQNHCQHTAVYPFYFLKWTDIFSECHYLSNKK